jgi:hypothetical protein
MPLPQLCLIFIVTLLWAAENTSVVDAVIESRTIQRPSALRRSCILAAEDTNQRFLAARNARVAERAQKKTKPIAGVSSETWRWRRSGKSNKTSTDLSCKRSKMKLIIAVEL